MADIANSEEIQEFLALNTDARIAFVKKPFIVSRIDKVWLLAPSPGYSRSRDQCACVCVCAQIVVNAIVDTLRTAFPRPDAQSPTEEDGDVDGLKLGSEKKSRLDSPRLTERLLAS